MQSVAGAVGASVVSDKLISAARSIGSHAFSFLEKTASILRDTKKGVPFAIAIVKLADFAKTDPNTYSGPVESAGEWLMNLDPTQLLGQPPQGPFYIDWNTINAILPDLQCNWGDLGCWIQNGLRALGRAVLGALYGVGSTIYWALWNFAYWTIKAVTFATGWFLKYVVANIVKFIISAMNYVADGIKKLMCMYLTYVAPFLSIYKGIADAASGKRALGIFELIAGTVLPLTIVSSECGVQLPPFTPPPSPTAPSPPPPSYTVPPNYVYPYDSVSISDYVSVELKMKTIYITDSIVINDGSIF